MTPTSEASPPLLGAFPTEGIWTTLGLGRIQFFAILATAIALFVFVDGPVWRHVHAAHFRRITISYGVIPLAVAAALGWNHTPRLSLLIGASTVLALTKLVLTAGLLIALALAGS